MARCACTGSCPCHVVAGAGMTVTGVGTSTDPFVITSGTGGGFLPLSGGTMTGAITLPGDPTSSGHAVTKEYVDARATIALPEGTPIPAGTPVGTVIVRY